MTPYNVLQTSLIINWFSLICNQALKRLPIKLALNQSDRLGPKVGLISSGGLISSPHRYYTNLQKAFFSTFARNMNYCSKVYL